MSNTNYRKNKNLIASNINSLNLSGDGHVHGTLYSEDLYIDGTITSDIIVGTDHITTTLLNTDSITTLNEDRDNINMNGKKLSNVGIPIENDDVATKQYVDNNTSSIPNNLVENPLDVNLDANQKEITNISGLRGNNINPFEIRDVSLITGKSTNIIGNPRKIDIDSTTLEFGNALCIEGNEITPTDFSTYKSLGYTPVDSLIINGSLDMTRDDFNLSLGGDITLTNNGTIKTNRIDSATSSGSIVDFNNTTLENVNNVNAVSINKTETPSYFHFGQVNPGHYTIAEIPDITQAEGDITVHIRCLEPGKKQVVVFNCIALPEKTSITVLSHTHENSSLIPLLTVRSLVYGTSGGSNTGILCFNCGNINASNNNVEITIYQNQSDKGIGQPYGNGFIPVSAIIQPIITNTITEYSFEIDNQIGTTDNMFVKRKVKTTDMEADKLITTRIETDVISTNSSGNINFDNKPIDGITDIQTLTISTNVVQPSTGSIVSLNNNNLGDITQLKTDEITTISGGVNSEITVSNDINMGSNKIRTTNVATTDTEVVNKLFVSNNTYFETNGTDIYSKNSVNNIGLGVTNPSYKLDINGDTKVTGGTIVTRDSRQKSSTTDGVTYITNDTVNSEGLSNFRVFPSSRNDFVYKRVSAFNKTFTADNQTFDVTIPDCLFYPNDGLYSKGVGMVKICYSSIGFTSQGHTLSSIHYKELVVVVKHNSVGPAGSVVTQIHENVHNQTDGNTEYVTVSKRYKILDGSFAGEVNTNNLYVGADVAVGVRFTSQNITPLAYKSLLKGTIEAI